MTTLTEASATVQAQMELADAAIAELHEALVAANAAGNSVQDYPALAGSPAVGGGRKAAPRQALQATVARLIHDRLSHAIAWGPHAAPTILAEAGVADAAQMMARSMSYFGGIDE